MAIVDNPPSDRWYQAQILGLADITTSATVWLGGDSSAAALHALRQAVAQLLPSTLDIYLTMRMAGQYSSVRITNIPLGVLGMSLPDPDGHTTLSLWVADTGAQPHAYDGEPTPPLLLSSAIAVHAARRALGDGLHQLDLGEYGDIMWSPARVRIEPHAGVPHLIAPAREFDWHDEVIGNYTTGTSDPGYAAWLWFTDPQTGEAEGEPIPLTPTLSGMHPNPDVIAALTPPRPPRLFVPSLTEPAGEQPE